MTHNHDILTQYQTTNCRLFQTERVCRRQLQIWRKWQEVIQAGRKHCRKRRNCSLRAISPFTTVFSKGLFPRGVKRCHLCGNGLTTPRKRPYGNIVGKEGNAGNQHFILFLQCFLPFPNRISVFHLHIYCRLQMLWTWTSIRFCRLVKSWYT